MQTEPGSIPGLGEALAKFSRNYAELYWDFNESIPRPLGGQEEPENVFIFHPQDIGPYAGKETTFREF